MGEERETLVHDARRILLVDALEQQRQGTGQPLRVLASAVLDFPAQVWAELERQMGGEVVGRGGAGSSTPGIASLQEALAQLRSGEADALARVAQAAGALTGGEWSEVKRRLHPAEPPPEGLVPPPFEEHAVWRPEGALPEKVWFRVHVLLEEPWTLAVGGKQVALIEEDLPLDVPRRDHELDSLLQDGWRAFWRIVEQYRIPLKRIAPGGTRVQVWVYDTRWHRLLENALTFTEVLRQLTRHGRREW